MPNVRLSHLEMGWRYVYVYCSLDLDKWMSRDRWSSDSSSSEEEGEGAVFAAPQPEVRPLQQLTQEELQMVSWLFISL